MDEATLRIKLEGDSGGAAGGGSGMSRDMPQTPTSGPGGGSGAGVGGFSLRYFVGEFFGPLGAVIFDLVVTLRKFKAATEAATASQTSSAAVNVRVMSAATQAGKPIITPYTPVPPSFGGLLPPPPAEAARMANAAKGLGELVEYQGPYQVGPTRRSGVPATIPEGTPGELGGGGAGAALAAGAIALVALEINKKMRSAAGSAGYALGGLASFVGGGTAPGNTVSQLGSGLQKFGESLPPVVAGLDILLIATGSLTNAFGQLMQAVDTQVDRYAQFSSQLAFATSMADLRMTMGDIRRAREIGPALAEYVNARTELQQKIEDTKARIMEQAAPILISAMKVVEVNLPAIEVAIRVGLLPLNLIAKIINTIEWIRNLLDKPDEVPLLDPVSRDLVEGFPYFEVPAASGRGAIDLTGLR